MNTDSQIKLRRYCDNLRLSGMSYIILGIWAVIKILAMLTMDANTVNELAKAFSQAGLDPNDPFVKLIYQIMILIMVLIILYVHLRIGTGAIRYSKGRKKKGFLFLAFIVAAFTAFSIVMDLIHPEYGLFSGYSDSKLGSLVIDVTVLFIFIDTFVAIKMIDRYRENAD